MRKERVGDMGRWTGSQGRENSGFSNTAGHGSQGVGTFWVGEKLSKVVNLSGNQT
jgi:hypothetical protein